MSWYKHKLVIDRSVWRCGSNGPFKHGSGKTLLFDNETSLMCCIGQACLQLDRTVQDIRSRGVSSDIEWMTNNYLIEYDIDTLFTNSAISINDNSRLSRTGRELSLFMLGKKHGIFIQFIGKYSDETNL